MKFLSNALFKGSLTAEKGLVLSANQNVVTTNQSYLLASNYANAIFAGWDTSAVYLGYSMGTIPVHIGTNGSGDVRIKTSGNTVVENGNLLVGTTTNSGYKVDINGEVRASLYRGANGAPLITFDAATNRVKLDGQGYGTTVGNSLVVADYISVEARAVFNSLIRVKGSNSVVSYGISRPDAPALDAVALAGIGPKFNTLWYTGAGLSFYVSEGADISGGAYIVEKLRLDPNGDLSVLNLAGTGNRMVVSDSTGKLGVQSIPSFTESDTLDSVTDRGATTTNSITTGTHTVNGYVSITSSTGGAIEFYPEGGSNATYSWMRAKLGSGLAPTLAWYGDVGGAYNAYGIYGPDSTYDGLLIYKEAPILADVILMGATKIALPSTQKLIWSSSTNVVATPDVGISRESAGLLQINNSSANTYASLKLLNLTATSLAGTGTRMVVTNANGTLSAQAIPTGTVLGTGSTNYVSKWVNSTTLGNSTIYDDGNGVGIGTATLNAQTRLTVMGSQSYSKSIVLDSTWNYQTSWAMKNGIYSTEFNLGGSTKSAAEGGPGSLQISTYNSSTSTYRYPITFFANANVSFGGTSGTVPTDNGSTVQVNGSASISGLAGSGTRMVVANASGVLSTQTITSTGLQTAVDTDKTSSGTLSVGTTAIKTLSATTYTGVFFDYVVKNGTNVRVGSVVAITNGTNVEFYETLSNDIGTTTAITFTVDLNGGNIRLLATTTATGWSVIVSTRGI